MPSSDWRVGQVIPPASTSRRQATAHVTLGQFSLLACGNGTNVWVYTDGFTVLQLVDVVESDVAAVAFSRKGKLAVGTKTGVNLYSVCSIDLPPTAASCPYRWSLALRLRETSMTDVMALSWSGESRLLAGGARLHIWSSAVSSASRARSATPLMAPAVPGMSPHVRSRDADEPAAGASAAGMPPMDLIWSASLATPVSTAEFSPDGRHFASCSQFDRLVRVWHAIGLSDTTYSFTYLPHTRSLVTLEWLRPSSNDVQRAGNLCLTLARDGVVRLWTEMPSEAKDSVQYHICHVLRPDLPAEAGMVAFLRRRGQVVPLAAATGGAVSVHTTMTPRSIDTRGATGTSASSSLMEILRSPALGGQADFSHAVSGSRLHRNMQELATIARMPKTEWIVALRRDKVIIWAVRGLEDPARSNVTGAVVRQVDLLPSAQAAFQNADLLAMMATGIVGQDHARRQFVIGLSVLGHDAQGHLSSFDFYPPHDAEHPSELQATDYCLSGGHVMPVSSMYAHPCRPLFASIDTSGLVLLWDVSEEALWNSPHILSYRSRLELDSSVSVAAWAPDSDVLFCACEHKIVIVDLASGSTSAVPNSSQAAKFDQLRVARHPHASSAAAPPYLLVARAADVIDVWQFDTDLKLRHVCQHIAEPGVVMIDTAPVQQSVATHEMPFFMVVAHRSGLISWFDIEHSTTSLSGGLLEVSRLEAAKEADVPGTTVHGVRIGSVVRFCAELRNKSGAFVYIWELESTGKAWTIEARIKVDTAPNAPVMMMWTSRSDHVQNLLIACESSKSEFPKLHKYAPKRVLRPDDDRWVPVATGDLWRPQPGEGSAASQSSLLSSIRSTAIRIESTMYDQVLVASGTMLAFMSRWQNTCLLDDVTYDLAAPLPVYHPRVLTELILNEGLNVAIGILNELEQKLASMQERAIADARPLAIFNLAALLGDVGDSDASVLGAMPAAETAGAEPAAAAAAAESTSDRAEDLFAAPATGAPVTGGGETAEDFMSSLSAPAASNRYDDLFAPPEPVSFKLSFDDDDDDVADGGAGGSGAENGGATKTAPGPAAPAAAAPHKMEFEAMSADSHLAEMLMTIALPELARQEQLQLIALVQTVQKLGSKEAGLDSCALRFLVSSRVESLVQRASGRGAGPVTLPTACYAWALHSEAQDDLCNEWIKPTTTWPEVRGLGFALWCRTQTTLVRVAEQLAKAQFLIKKDPVDSMLLYLALDKKATLVGLFKAVKDEKMLTFCSKDFSEERNVTAALKNAYVLLSQQRFELAASFFLLAGKHKDCVNVLAKNMKDVHYALLIARLLEAPAAGSTVGPLAQQLLEDIFLPQALDASDVWLASTVHWLLRDHATAFHVLFRSSRHSVGATFALATDMARDARVRMATDAAVLADLIYPALYSYSQAGCQFLVAYLLRRHRSLLAIVGRTDGDVSLGTSVVLDTESTAPSGTSLAPPTGSTLSTTGPSSRIGSSVFGDPSPAGGGVIDWVRLSIASQLLRNDAKNCLPADSAVLTANFAFVSSSFDVRGEDLFASLDRFCRHQAQLMPEFAMAMGGKDDSAPVRVIEHASVAALRFSACMGLQTPTASQARRLLDLGRQLAECLRSDENALLDADHTVAALVAMHALSFLGAWYLGDVDFVLRRLLHPLGQSLDPSTTSDYGRSPADIRHLLGEELDHFDQATAKSDFVDDEDAADDAGGSSDFVGVLSAAPDDSDSDDNLPSARFNSMKGQIHVAEDDAMAYAQALRQYAQQLGEYLEAMFGAAVVQAHRARARPLGATVTAAKLPVRDLVVRFVRDLLRQAEFLLGRARHARESHRMPALTEKILAHRAAALGPSYDAKVIEGTLLRRPLPFILHAGQIKADPLPGGVGKAVYRRRLHDYLSNIDGGGLARFLPTEDDLDQSNMSTNGSLGSLGTSVGGSTSVLSTLAGSPGGGLGGGAAGDEATGTDLRFGRAEELFKVKDLLSSFCVNSGYPGSAVVGTSKGLREVAFPDDGGDYLAAEPHGALGARQTSMLGGTVKVAGMSPVGHRAGTVPSEVVTGFFRSTSSGSNVELSEQTVNAMCAHPDMPMFLTGGNDGTVRLWSFGQARSLSTYKAWSRTVNGIHFNEHGTKFAACNKDGNVSLYNFNTTDESIEPFWSARCHSDARDVAFLTSATFLATTGSSGSTSNVGLWDTLLPAHRSLVHSLNIADGGECMAFSPLHLLLLVGGKKGDVTVVDIRQRRELARFQAHQLAIKDIAIDPTEDFFATASSDGDIKVFRLSAGDFSRVEWMRGYHEKQRFYFGGGSAVRTYGARAVHFADGYLYSCGADGRLLRTPYAQPDMGMM